MTRGLILDCDGVLADTEKDGHLVAFNMVFEEMDLPFRWDEEIYDDLLKIGGGKERVRGYLADHPEYQVEDVVAFSTEVHRRKTLHYIDLMNSGAVPGRPGIARLIDEALDAGWKVAVASTSAQQSVEAVLDCVVGPETRARLAGVFAGDVVPAKKPAPDIYLMALEEAGLRRDQAVVVEDSQSGAAAARAAEIPYIVTLSHFTADDRFEGEYAIVTDLGEPDAPLRVVRGPDFTAGTGYVDVAALERVIEGSRAQTHNS